MSTYPAESFYRGTIRQSIANNTSVPFTLKVSKIPTLTSWLLTVSPNTANEELIEYSGVDGTALTITVIKRWISPSAQALTVNGTDYNNVTYQKSHSQNDTIRGDVNHLHIIQDYGSLQTQINNKVNTVWGVRTWLSNNAIMRTNGSWVESADVISAITPVDTDTILLQRTGDIWEATYLSIKNDIASSIATPSVQEINFESIITSGNLIWQTPDGIYKVQTEIKTSTALWGTNTYMDHCQVSPWKFLILYAVWGNMTAVIATLTSADAMSYGTPLNLWAAATPTGKVALINTNKVVAVYAATASVTAVNVILTISWTSVTAGTPLNESQAANVAITSVCKVRTDCYAYCFGVGASPSGIKVNTVSGTTISAGTVLATFAFWFTQNTVFCAYLSDNLISFSEGITSGSSITNVKIYAITGWGTTVATTYTGTISSQQWTNYHARYSDTEVIITNSVTTEKSIFTIPWAGTTLVKTTLTANGAANYPVTPLFTNIYAINTGTTILIYQRDILIGTIASTPAYNTQGIHYDNGRIIFFNGTTLIPTIVNLASVFVVWVAFNNTWLFTPWKNKATISWIIKWYRYYIQSDWVLSNWIGTTNTVSMTRFYWRWVLTNTIMTEL